MGEDRWTYATALRSAGTRGGRDITAPRRREGGGGLHGARVEALAQFVLAGAHKPQPLQLARLVDRRRCARLTQDDDVAPDGEVVVVAVVPDFSSASLLMKSPKPQRDRFFSNVTV